jgi:hypothetical protein
MLATIVQVSFNWIARGKIAANSRPIGFTHWVTTLNDQQATLNKANPLARIEYGRISVVYEYGKGLHPILKAALYKKRVTMLA